MSAIELIVRTIIKRGDSILVCRNKKKGNYFLPGGHVEFGDSLKETIIKELGEELGVGPEALSGFSFRDYFEQTYGDEEKHHELNMIFDVEMNPSIEARSQEDHIDFEWKQLSELDSIKLLPQGIVPIILSR